MTDSKLILKRCLKTMNMLDSKHMEGKWNHDSWFMQILKYFSVKTLYEQISCNILLVVMAVN